MDTKPLKLSGNMITISTDPEENDNIALRRERAALLADNERLRAALEAAIERMEAVADGIPVNNRANGVSQATHVAHMAGHLAQHAKIARAALRGDK